MEHCPYLLLKSLKKTVHESLLVLCVCCPGGNSLPHARQALTGAAEGLSSLLPGCQLFFLTFTASKNFSLLSRSPLGTLPSSFYHQCLMGFTSHSGQ